MASVIIFIGILFLFLVFFAIAFVLSVLSKLFGGIENLWYILTGKKVRSKASYGGSSKTYSSSNSYSSSSTNNASQSSSGASNHKKDGKVFTADEGEYIAFEEIKN